VARWDVWKCVRAARTIVAGMAEAGGARADGKAFEKAEEKNAWRRSCECETVVVMGVEWVV
jgi:hypothetical protein